MKRLTRSTDDKKIAGVLGGMGTYFNIDSTILRLLAVILIFVSFGTVVFGYLAAIFIIPKDTEVF